MAGAARLEGDESDARLVDGHNGRGTDMTDRPPSLTVLLPVRNETMNLRVMLRILQAVLVVPHETIVIFDHPDDVSAPIVAEMQAVYPQVRSLLNAVGRGVAFAVRAGGEAARGERILIFAPDEVGPVLAIEDMMSLMDEGVEFVSATRYAHGGRRLGGSLVGGGGLPGGNQKLYATCGPGPR